MENSVLTIILQMEMAHVMHHVAVGNNVITLAQLVAALNSNSGVGNAKPMLYTVNRTRMKTFETGYATELRRLKKLKRTNDIFLWTMRFAHIVIVGLMLFMLSLFQGPIFVRFFASVLFLFIEFIL